MIDERVAQLTVKQIQERAKSIITSNPGGIRYTPLANQIVLENPETNEGTIYTSVSNLDKTFPNEISKPSRGLYTPAMAAEADPVSIATTEEVALIGATLFKESELYKPFADWLKNELEEVTEVAALGGGGLRGKWGTPDVVGTYKKQPGNVIEFPIEIVSAEIKIDPSQPVVAFGQAIAYRLFSTKTFIVMPSTLTAEDKDRLDSLCMLFGVGLVLFKLEETGPQFSIRVRAQRFSPDMFYANEFADRLRQVHPEMFRELFR
jgi:hypothetical protein